MSHKKHRTKPTGKSDKKKHDPPPPGIMKTMEKSMAGFAGAVGRERTAVDEAQMIIYDAWESDDPRERVSLARKALLVSADCADAYVLLAEESARTLEEAIDLFRKGIEAGERALGERAFKEDVGHFWGMLETRPYMRARAGLAECLWEAGRREEAVDHYQDMLRLNPNDNQGIRYMLMPWLIEMNRDKDAERLFKKYRNDASAFWLWSRVLLDFRRLGDSPEARRSFIEASEYNPHVVLLLTGRKKMPRHLPEYYGIADENEAVSYVYGSMAAWKASAGAVPWLAAQTP